MSGLADNEASVGLKVEILNFDDLPGHMQEPGMVSNNGCGREYANYLRVTHNGEEILFESDAMEPEDARLTRDLKWIIFGIQRAYELGKADGSKFAERTCLEYCEIAGELAAFVEWIVARDGECLGDHPQQLAYAKRILAKAKAKRDPRTSS